MTLLLAAGMWASPTYFLVTTDQSGAQTQIDTDHSSIWFFEPSVSFVLGGGNFVMKDGPHTSLNVGLTLFDGVPAGGTTLAELTFTNAQFARQLANSQSFSQHQFLFASAFTVLAAHRYTLVLHSNAPDQQADAYFIKGEGAPYFATSPTDSAVPLTGPITNVVGDPILATVPEPKTYLLASTAFILFASFRAVRRRQLKSVPVARSHWSMS